MKKEGKQNRSARSKKGLRLFIAADLPPETIEIFDACEKMLASVGVNARWVRPESIHLTLRFLGDTDPGQAEILCRILSDSAVGMAPVFLQLKGLGCFPNLRRPRVIWAGVRGEVDRLAAFQNDLETRIRAAGFPAEPRPFRPHLTLGRFRAGEETGPVSSAISKYENRIDADCPVAGVHLLKSDLRPDGARYTRLFTAPFSETP